MSDEWKQPQCMFLCIHTFVHLALASHAGIFGCSEFPKENNINVIRHKEHTHCIKTNNIISVYALHILITKHEHGYTEKT